MSTSKRRIESIGAVIVVCTLIFVATTGKGKPHAVSNEPEATNSYVRQLIRHGARCLGLGLDPDIAASMAISSKSDLRMDYHPVHAWSIFISHTDNTSCIGRLHSEDANIQDILSSSGPTEASSYVVGGSNGDNSISLIIIPKGGSSSSREVELVTYEPNISR